MSEAFNEDNISEAEMKSESDVYKHALRYCGVV